MYAHEDIKVSSKVSSIYAQQMLSEMSPAFRDSKWLSILLIVIYCPTMLTFETSISKYKECKDSYFLKNVLIYCYCNLKNKDC